MSKRNTKRTSRLRKWCKRFLFVLLILTVYASWQIWDIHRYGHVDDGGQADCAIVLGAAAYYNKPSPVFKARIDHAIKLYKEGRVKKVILTGGFGKDAEFAESEVAYEYCLKNGIPDKDLYKETESKTTEQNIAQAKKLMDKFGMESALLVSDPWHLKRAHAIAEKYEMQNRPSATLTTMYKSDESRLKFLMREFYYIHVWRFADL
ncbi:Uncharacterized SAM-binding protein YcdF, DUF218 family [Rubritalea squalenifaciens DSM 18772]|uniref:Uncharacterized SAM-binding protein YcdF, DUF218 family n=1 Tax=Rubritalea squalenifaciens DSM 18772 TaxID=1123071 RepID=A0A1M6DE28_9BACT|nr:YdcF family protein [Rubritalea squalenifaciens]SHI71516.1 Uncharacterized SAM-binding protein YcdF, DUF218 family [Rubritalea squalenifaciens DSM 18772]